MKIKQQYNRWNFAACILSIFTMCIALMFCFFMIQSINQRMNESATSNLLNTTRVIKETFENQIEKDLESLYMIGELYRKDTHLDTEKMLALSDAMKFEQIRIVDAEGNGVVCNAEPWNTSDFLHLQEWRLEQAGYSNAYSGPSGRLQTTLWMPIYQKQQLICTVFGSTLLSKYYSSNIFTFYEGEGRTYLFDGANGKWILKSMGLDGTNRRQEDIYSLLLTSGNKPETVDAFQQVIETNRTGTAIFQFNDELSYICFMPLSSSPDWYIATVIAKDVLLKESAEVKKVIQLIFIIFCITIFFSTITLAIWQIRKTKTKEMQYREKIFANVSANIDSVFLIYEKSSKKAVFVSDNVKRLLGLERNYLQADAGRLFDWCKINCIDPLRIAFLDGLLDKPAIREVCVENELRSNSRYLRLELIPADLNQEIAVITDITKDKDIQNSLLEAMEQAEAASHAKNDFLSAMSHDIRTPMNGIIGMTTIAATHLDDKNRIQDCLKKINEASMHLLNLINEVLDMSQIESGKIELSEEAFNLPELLQEVLDMSYPGIRQKEHSLNVYIHSMEHEKVLGDSLRLQRVITNLISNAVKYTPNGGTITLTLQEKPSILHDYGCYALSIQDNGIGMSPEFQEKLFEPFEREEDVRISRIQGTGLGMSIVKNIVSLMMGDIQVESEKNKGSVFLVTINLKLDEQDTGQNKALDALSVLVVDDDIVACETITSILNDIGMAGEWTDNGAEAIKKVAEQHHQGTDYTAVLLDWKMPDMDGIETARRIRTKVDTSVPIIILSAYNWSEIESEAKQAGVDAFLSKPIYKAKLKQKMIELTNKDHFPEVQKNLHHHKIPPGKRILLVEDNALNIEITVELLQILGVKTDLAQDGAAAVHLFADSKIGAYDLILMDIQMPKMNGYEATRAIRSMPRADSQTIPIIAMTADAFSKDIQSAHLAGMNEHLAKPISIERLIQVLSIYFSQTENKKADDNGAND